MSDDKHSTSQTPLQRLLPERVSYLLDERPLLWFEDTDAYDALLAELIAEYDPKGTMEFILIKDLADAQWEMTRLRQLRQAAVEAELPEAAIRLMREDYENSTGKSFFEATYELRVMVRRAVQGDAEMAQELEHHSSEAGVTYRMMHYEAVKQHLKPIGAVEDAYARAERRRDQLIRMIEDRRRSLGAMGRSLVGQRAEGGSTDLSPEASGEGSA